MIKGLKKSMSVEGIVMTLIAFLCLLWMHASLDREIKKEVKKEVDRYIKEFHSEKGEKK